MTGRVVVPCNQQQRLNGLFLGQGGEEEQPQSKDTGNVGLITLLLPLLPSFGGNWCHFWGSLPQKVTNLVPNKENKERTSCRIVATYESGDQRR